MGTLHSSPVYSNEAAGIDDTLEEYGWLKNTTPVQVEAAAAVVNMRRERYLVDRHDEIASGFGRIAERACAAFEQSANALTSIAESFATIAQRSDPDASWPTLPPELQELANMYAAVGRKP